MKEKKLTNQNTKSLTIKKNEPKHLALKEKTTVLAKIIKRETALVKNTPKKKSLATTNKKETALQAVKKSEKSLTKTSKKGSNLQENNKTKTSKKSTKTSATKTKKSQKTTTKASKKISNKKQNTQKYTAYANEYFDLPYRYNETIIKLLAQTPKRLFVYWDISDKDRENYINSFGKDFFNNTIPFLRIKNETHNYTFDIDINDFANSWYIDINDDNSKYSIELYRRLKGNSLNNSINKEPLNYSITDNSIFIVSSNQIDAPNGKVLSTTYPRKIKYQNIKTNNISYKHIEKPTSEFYQIFFKDEKYNTKTNASSSRF